MSNLELSRFKLMLSIQAPLLCFILGAALVSGMDWLELKKLQIKLYQDQNLYIITYKDNHHKDYKLQNI